MDLKENGDNMKKSLDYTKPNFFTSNYQLQF
jgi:hypothetical protein